MEPVEHMSAVADYSECGRDPKGKTDGKTDCRREKGLENFLKESMDYLAREDEPA